MLFWIVDDVATIGRDEKYPFDKLPVLRAIIPGIPSVRCHQQDIGAAAAAIRFQAQGFFSDVSRSAPYLSESHRITSLLNVFSVYCESDG